MQLACCQFDIVWEDKPANYRRVEEMVRGARLEPGALLLLPEMFATGFSMNTAVTGEPVDGPTSRFLADLARDNGIYVIGGTTIAPAGGRPYNQASAYDPGGRRISSYSKIQLFTYGHEHEHYGTGDQMVSFNCGGADGPTVAPRVCYDLRFPELFRKAAADGASILTVIANWPVARQAHWLTLLRARAIENQAYVAGCNRVGRDGNGLVHVGGSQIIDFGGNVLADAGDAETIIAASVDLEALRDYRRKLPFLADMRR